MAGLAGYAIHSTAGKINGSIHNGMSKGGESREGVAPPGAARSSGTSSPPLPYLRNLDASCFELLGEGGMHAVFRVKAGAEERCRAEYGIAPNTVLRLRKQKDETLILDHDFRKHIVARLFKDSRVQESELFLLPGATAAELLGTCSKIQGVVDTAKRVVCSKLENALSLSSSSSAGAPTRHGGSLLSVELKPKCGLAELENQPSRFQLLQQVKLQKGGQSWWIVSCVMGHLRRGEVYT